MIGALSDTGRVAERALSILDGNLLALKGIKRRRGVDWHYLNDKSKLSDGEYESIVIHALEMMAANAELKLASEVIEAPLVGIKDQRDFYSRQQIAVWDAIRRFKFDHKVEEEQ
ncbi:hypothetical protein [Paenibacillus sp. L3-i20]|uniref:hypothetical protein n=1 Tax=Paenibacillus sp. L3-i20 TaxID=2905833 RepID=UPI001EE08710|nr:hypothetical protein [Paenibacillus sp. L3-i20]GKU80190.1 hypothetical protein L3i20_v245870 [Paenibacillus sp. L3-i20]